MRKKLFGSLLLISLICLMIPITFAENNATIPENGVVDNGFDLETLETLWQMLVSYVLASMVWALTGFFKLRDPKEEGFDAVQFFTTVIVGFVTGVIAFVIYITTGESLQPTQIWQYLLAAGFVAIVESWIKVIWRRLKPYFTPPTIEAEVSGPKS